MPQRLRLIQVGLAREPNGSYARLRGGSAITGGFRAEVCGGLDGGVTLHRIQT